MKALRQAALVIFIVALTLRIYAQGDQTPEDDLVYVNAVAWSHDGSKIAAVGIRRPAIQGYVRVFDAETGQTLYALDPNPGGFTSVTWSPDDRFIAAGGYDQVIWVFDVEANSHVATLWGHRATVNEVDWSPDGTRLVSSGSWDGLVILWDMTSYEQARIVEEATLFPFTVAFSPDNQRIAVGGEAGFRIRSANEQELAPPWYFQERNVAALAWSHDGSRLAFGTQTFSSRTNPNLRFYAHLYVIDSSNGNQLSDLATEDETIYGVAWSPDDRLIATHSIDGVVRIWEVATGAELENYPGVTQYPTGIGFSPYGGRLAYASAITSDLAVSAADQTDSVDAVQALANSGVHIVVPAPSLERLQAIAGACNAPITVERSLADFVAQVEALPENTIPSACAADLIAVAEALESQNSS